MSKRVLEIDLDNCTLDQVNAAMRDLKQKRKEFKAAAAKEEASYFGNRYYDFLQRTLVMWEKINVEEDDECSAKYALERAYEEEENVWYELKSKDTNAWFRNSCAGDDCWYSGNEDRIEGATFYENVLNPDFILCDMCICKNGRSSEFQTVFATKVDEVIKDLTSRLPLPAK